MLTIALSLMAIVQASAQFTIRTAPENQGSQSAYRFSKETDANNALFVSKATSDYGTEVSILNEPFTGLPNGSVGNPDLNTILTLPYPGEAQYPWTNFKPGYLNMDNWGAENVWQAGGTICLNADGQNFSHLNTPMLNVSAHGGIVFVRFKARTAEGYASNVLIEAAETYNMAPNWTILGAMPIPQVGPEWQTYEVMYYGGGSYSIFNLVAFDHAIYVDDFEVFQIDQHVATPVAMPHTDYKGTSFVAHWSKVDAAEDYILDVYTMEDGNQDFLLENQVVADTSFTVNNTVSGATYYYQVKSRKGQYSSIVSKAYEVFDLEIPVLNPVTNLTEGENNVTYTATWSSVPSAERYNYFTRFNRIAAEDGVFNVTKENFDGVVDAYGNPTGWTLEDPSYNSYDELYISALAQAGWKGTHYAPYTDYICLDAYHYMNNNGDAGLISPELDLSKDGGKIDLTVKLHAAKHNGADGVSYTRAAVALFVFNEEKGDFEQAELHYITEEDGLVDAWKLFNVQLTKGTSRSVIGIYAVYAPENLYIDDLTITQQYKKGESLMDPFLFSRYLETNSCDVTVPERVYGSEMFHQVAAVKTGSQPIQYQGYKVTPYSALESIGTSPDPTSIEHAVSLANATVQVVNGEILINNPMHEAVRIYDLNGKLLYADNSGASQLSVALGLRGAYIVQVGKTSVKLVY